MTLLKSSQLSEIIWSGWKIIAAVAIAALILGLIFEKARTPRWLVTAPLVVSLTGEQGNADFSYDHYYSFEASDSLTDSLEEWLKSPSVLDAVQSEAKTSFRSSSWSFWENNNWSVKKKAPQLVEVSFYTVSEKDAIITEKLLKNRVNDFLASFNQTGKPYFNLTNSSSGVEFQAPSWSLTSVLSLLWGILIGTILVLEKENLRRESQKSE